MLDRWAFRRGTRYVTLDGPVGELAATVTPTDDLRATAHALARAVRGRLTSEPGSTDVRTTAAEALGSGRGVCQDYAHVAPVLGSVDRARSGELTVLASGSDGDLDRAAPIFEVVGAETMQLGPAGAGSRLKLVFNVWILGTTTLGGEVLSLAEALGVGSERFLELIRGTFAD